MKSQQSCCFKTQKLLKLEELDTYDTYKNLAQTCSCAILLLKKRNKKRNHRTTPKLVHQLQLRPRNRTRSLSDLLFPSLRPSGPPCHSCSNSALTRCVRCLAVSSLLRAVRCGMHMMRSMRRRTDTEAKVVFLGVNWVGQGLFGSDETSRADRFLD